MALPGSPEVRGSEPSALSHHLCSPSYLVPDTFENQLAGLYGRKSTARWCFDWHFGVSVKDFRGNWGFNSVATSDLGSQHPAFLSMLYRVYSILANF